jgi:cell wall-associated NlpC family hydrolase
MYRISFKNVPVVLILLVILLGACNPSGHRRGFHAGKHSRKEVKRAPKTAMNKDKEKETNKEVSKRVSAELELRTSIVESAIKWQGKGYKYGGKSPETGFDCSGFTGYVFTQAGIPLNGPSHAQAKLGIKKDKESLSAGDLVFFGDKDKISHVAIVASKTGEVLEIIHATTTAGVRVDNISHSPYWEKRFLFGTDIITATKDISMQSR